MAFMSQRKLRGPQPTTNAVPTSGSNTEINRKSMLFSITEDVPTTDIDVSPLPGRRRSGSVPNIIFRRCSSGTDVNQSGNERKFGTKKFKIKDHVHSENFYSVLSLFYAIVLVAFGTSFLAAEMFGNNSMGCMRCFEGFYVYLFAVGIIFIVFVHIFILQDRFGKICSNSWRKLVNKWTKLSLLRDPGSHVQQKPTIERRVRKISVSTNVRVHTGSFYLRLGAVGFGIGGMIHGGLEFGEFLEADPSLNCTKLTEVTRPVVQLVFVLAQTYFIFRNSKVSIHRFRAVVRFGMMHLVAANLCVWLRVITMETIHDLHEHATDHHGSSEHRDPRHHLDHPHLQDGLHRGFLNRSNSSNENDLPRFSVDFNESETRKIIEDVLISVATSCDDGVRGLLAKTITDISPYLCACTVEYSLISAAVTYLIWRNIGRREMPSHSSSGLPEVNTMKLLQRMRVDCSSVNRGLFFGMFLFILTIINMIVFFAFTARSTESRLLAVFLMYINKLVLYSLSFVAVCCAAFAMRILRFNKFLDNSLDQILLLVALVGVYTFSVFSAICGFHRTDSPLGIMVLATSVIVLFQSTIQTVFILNGLRRSAGNSLQESNKPGRQYVTFLVVSNIALWAIDSFEVLKSDSNPLAMEFYGRVPWSLITHISIPLTIFYRYHSTVCLADIWKDAYKPSHH